MDKGWGIALDSDSLGFFLNKPPPSKFDHAAKRSVMFAGMEFPASKLACRDEQAAHQQSDENRTAVGVVDFFSDKKRLVNDDDDDDDCDDHSKTISTSVIVKKENSQGDAITRPSLDVNTGLHLLTANTGSDQSTVDDGVSSNLVEEKRAKTEMAQLQVELQRMNAENQKLRDMLSQVTHNYSALQMHLMAVMQQQQMTNNRPESTQEQENVDQVGKVAEQETKQERQFLDLGPSADNQTEIDRVSNDSSSEERTRSATPQNNVNELSYRKKDVVAHNNNDQDEGSNLRDGKRVGREESPESESQGWGPNKVPKLNNGSKPIEQSADATMRKARVSVRARSEAPMITDGCQWRKYGQKMAKGNPCPRAYYRCTMAVGCPVRKQVQRCAEDRTILITTYEGNHNHPLPPAAMAMASTTAAAANMLLSGSMSSGDGLMNPNLLARAILPHSSSVATISASAPFPTVTLDLTNNSNPLQFQRPQAPFQVPFTGGQPQNFGAVVPPPSSGAPAHSILPQVFGQALYNQSKFSGLQLSTGQDMGSNSQLGHQVAAVQLHQTQQANLADSVSAATAAITADPNFTAALAAAISSIIGGAHPNNAASAANTNNFSNNSSKIGGFPGN